MLKAVTNLVNVSQIVGVLPVVNGGTGVTTSTGTGNTVLSAAPTLSGNVTLSTGNLIVASGQGIDFSADPSAAGMTSELLDDYEEGTWTPAYSGSTTNPTVTYYVQDGTYAKIGRMVYWSAEITTTATTGGSGNLQISGFPFACGSRYTGGATINYANGWTLAAPNVATIFNGATVMVLYANSATTSTNTITTNLTNGTVYLVAFGMYSV